MFNFFKKQPEFKIHTLRIGEKYYKILAKKIMQNKISNAFGVFDFTLFLAPDAEYILYISKKSLFMDFNFTRAFLSKSKYINEFWTQYHNQRPPDYSFESALEKIYIKYLNKYMTKNKAFSSERIFVTDLEKQIDDLEQKVEDIEICLKEIFATQ